VRGSLSRLTVPVLSSQVFWLWAAATAETKVYYATLTGIDRESIPNSTPWGYARALDRSR